MSLYIYIYIKTLERNKRETTSPNTFSAISSSSGCRSGLTCSGGGVSGLMTSLTQLLFNLCVTQW